MMKQHPHQHRNLQHQKSLRLINFTDHFEPFIPKGSAIIFDQSSQERGVTLIELLITIAISSVLFLYAYQSYRSFQQTLHEEIIQFELSQLLKTAKSLASIEERGISLCGSFDGKICVTAEEKQWQGWILFYDELATFTPKPEFIIQHQPSNILQKKGFHLRTTSNIGGGINFRARREYAYGMARSLANGRIKLCPTSQSTIQSSPLEHYEFIINVYGYSRLTKEKGACS